MQLQQYIQPLLKGHWALRFHTRTLLLKGGELLGVKYLVPCLRRWFHFGNVDDASAFLKDVVRVSEEEGNEPLLVIKEHVGEEKEYRVAVYSMTPDCHDAVSLIAKGSQRVGPGLSLMDARFGIILEREFSDNYLSTGRGRDPKWRWTQVPKNVYWIKERQWRGERALIRQMTKPVFGSMVTPSLEGVVPLPIPDAPASAEGACGDEEFTTLIKPLYSRGWYVVYNHQLRKLSNAEITLKKYPIMTGFYDLKMFDVAVAFTQDVLTLARAENIAVSLWVDSRTVTVQGTSEMSMNISLREARFAILVERLFAEKYKGHPRTDDVHPLSLLAQPQTVKELRNHPLSNVNPKVYENLRVQKMVQATLRKKGDTIEYIGENEKAEDES
ncbi:hypothetical protein AMATHDRAFT_62189, partial [Amanita thiersii Skay4041]